MTASGEFRFNFYSSNGQVIATGEAYSSMVNCEKEIEYVKTNFGLHIEDQTNNQSEI